MRLVFMGTPEFAVPSLEAVAKEHEVVLVVTRPDAVRGRGKQLVASSVKERALELGFPVLEARRMTEDVLAAIAGLAPDVACVVAYGCILPDELLALPRLGAINVHASLLPRWRGAAPIQRAMLAGDAEAGVSIMRIATELDAGPWCRQASVPIGDKNAEALTHALAELGAQELVAGLAEVEAGTATWHEQASSEVTFAPKLTKAEMLLDPAVPAAELLRLVRASGDTAPARALVAGRALRVLNAQLADTAPAQGEVVREGKRVILGCAEGGLELLCVRPDGKRDMEVAAWAQGLQGSRLMWERL